MSHNQAPLCLYTLRLISNQPEGTFARLRYLLGGDRPSQTASHALCTKIGVRQNPWQGWYFKDVCTPTYPTHAHRFVNANVQ